MQTAELVTWDDGTPSYIVEFEDPALNEYATFTFTVYELVGTSREKYLSGFIKFDGCCHFNFGDEHGYLHLCGKQGMDNLKNLLDALWEFAESQGVITC